MEYLFWWGEREFGTVVGRDWARRLISGEPRGGGAQFRFGGLRGQNNLWFG